MSGIVPGRSHDRRCWVLCVTLQLQREREGEYDLVVCLLEEEGWRTSTTKRGNQAMQKKADSAVRGEIFFLILRKGCGIQSFHNQSKPKLLALFFVHDACDNIIHRVLKRNSIHQSSINPPSILHQSSISSSSLLHHISYTKTDKHRGLTFAYQQSIGDTSNISILQHSKQSVLV